MERPNKTDRLVTKRPRLLVAMVVVIVIVAAVLLRGRPDTDITVTFQHFIDPPGYGRMALFAVTNRGSQIIEFEGSYCEQRTDKAWRKYTAGVTTTNGAARNSGRRAFSQKFWFAGDTWDSFGALKPGASANVAAAVPDVLSHNWRGAVIIVRRRSKLEELQFHLSHNWNAVLGKRALPGFDAYVPMGTNISYSDSFTAEFDPGRPPSSLERAQP